MSLYGTGEPVRADDAATSTVHSSAGHLVVIRPDVSVQFRAMASEISVRIVNPSAEAASLACRARAVFEEVERTCTRFVATSPLMLANASPQAWHPVPAELFDAVTEAARAHEETAGLFDPRVLRVLEAYGYDRSLPFAAGGVTTSARPRQASTAKAPRAPWRPGLDRCRSAVQLGADPIDLGGIGKGLAVRWAAEQLAAAGRSVLIEAGGDCHLGGPGPDGDGWKVGVEDPFGGAKPVAVLALEDLACATSSVRLRRWRADGEPVHHLIDPRSGRPGGAGLAAVTVVGPDPAWAEVWSKSLFLSGAEGIRALAAREQLAALWVHEDGSLGTTPELDLHLAWRIDA